MPSMSAQSFVSISLSENKLEAYLQIHNWDETYSLTEEDLHHLLKQHGVVYGVRHDLLAKISAHPANYLIDKIVVATGDEPVQGDHGSIRFLYEKTDLQSSPKKMDDGKVDLREIRQLNNVSKGQPIAEKLPPSAGIPGKTVTGEEIPAKAGKEAYFKIGKNVVANGDILYATIDGLVTMTDRDKVNVFPVYEVNGDVDYAIGNIEFIGNVVVRGNVLPGFRVRAMGDIRVIGGVEAAELDADGSIEITAGILGQNKGFVKAGKNVKAGFMQDANVYAVEDVIVTQSILHSHVKAGRNVICMGSKGLVVGGTIQAGEKVSVRTLGNTMSTPTVVEVGALPELRNELQELQRALRGTRENLAKTEKALALLDQLAASGQLSPDKLAMRIRLANTKKSSMEEIEQMKQRSMEIELELEDSNKAEVEVTSMVYGGTKIVIGRYIRFVKDPIRMIKFRIVDGEISMISNV